MTHSLAFLSQNNQRVWMTVDQICTLVQRPLYTTLLWADYERRIITGLKAWAGGEAGTELSRAQWIGPMKAMELLLVDLHPEFARTPTDHVLTTGFPGGTRYGVRRLLSVISCSAWAGVHDELMAALLQYVALLDLIGTGPFRLHHVGFGHGSALEMRKAVRADEQRFGAKALDRSNAEQQRFYIPVESPSTPRGFVWVEHTNTDAGVEHWDFYAPNPEVFLSTLTSWIGCRLETWTDSGPNDPLGMVEVTSGQNVTKRVMARGNWWDINAG